MFKKLAGKARDSVTPNTGATRSDNGSEQSAAARKQQNSAKTLLKIGRAHV